MDKIINGKEISKRIKEELKQEIEVFSRKPSLVVIQVGNDIASDVYIEGKKKASLEVGIDFKHLKYEEDVTEEVLIEKIQELNSDDMVDGILLQLPLPKHLNEVKIINYIDPSKDVDGLTITNIGKLTNKIDGLVSCTPLGIMELLSAYNVELEGKHVVIVGRSNLVGKPLISLFLNNNATVTVCHSKTKDLSEYTKQADILVVAVGKKNLITRDMVKKDAVVIDVGINREDGKIYGDVYYLDVFDKVSLITPVPGGVGPMTVTMLLKNVVKCYKNKITS